MTTIALDNGANTLHLHYELYIKLQLASAIDRIGHADEGGHSITIYDQDKDAMTSYIDWLYCGKVEGYEFRDGDTNYLDLAQLYIFGQRIEDDKLCDEVMEAIPKGLDKPPSNFDCWLPGPEEVKLVYENTEVEDPLRRLLVDCTVELATAYWFDDVETHGPPEFVTALLRRYAQVKRGGEKKSFRERKAEWLERR